MPERDNNNTMIAKVNTRLDKRIPGHDRRLKRVEKAGMCTGNIGVTSAHTIPRVTVNKSPPPRSPFRGPVSAFSRSRRWTSLIAWAGEKFVFVVETSPPPRARADYELFVALIARPRAPEVLGTQKTTTIVNLGELGFLAARIQPISGKVDGGAGMLVLYFSNGILERDFQFFPDCFF